MGSMETPAAADDAAAAAKDAPMLPLLLLPPLPLPLRLLFALVHRLSVDAADGEFKGMSAAAKKKAKKKAKEQAKKATAAKEGEAAEGESCLPVGMWGTGEGRKCAAPLLAGLAAAACLQLAFSLGLQAHACLPVLQPIPGPTTSCLCTPCAAEAAAGGAKKGKGGPKVSAAVKRMQEAIEAQRKAQEEAERLAEEQRLKVGSRG